MLLALNACVIVTALVAQDPTLKPGVGKWYAWLDTPGGALEFGLEVSDVADDGAAVIVNADERIAVDDVTWHGEELRIEFPHFDSRIFARREGNELVGVWTKRTGSERVVELPFHAATHRYDQPGGPDCSVPPSGVPPAPRPWTPGRFALHFHSDDEEGVLEVSRENGVLRATVLSTTGDYRFLGARSDVRGDRHLALSCFDGSHAFLFRAKWAGDHTLDGQFWSGSTWHDTWTATLDPDAKLPDPFELTRVNPTAKLADLRFPGLDGVVRSLDDGELKGAPTVIQLFGSWCPNCHDEAPYLAELDRRYRARGLRIAGIAFELTGELARDTEQVKRFRARHGIEYPLFVGGLSDKKEASKAFPLLDRVRAYPTTLFVRRDGTVLAVHQGFSGPATGKEHEKLRIDFERRIEDLLREGTTK
jgi:thiol-disulfide isomerase/thioredoxin